MSQLDEDVRAAAELGFASYGKYIAWKYENSFAMAAPPKKKKHNNKYNYPFPSTGHAECWNKVENSHKNRSINCYKYIFQHVKLQKYVEYSSFFKKKA